MAKTKRQPVSPLERFHKHFSSASQWAERWEASLYPALIASTRYATLRNRFAPREEFETVMQGIKQLEQITLPRHEQAGSADLECYVSDSADEKTSTTKPFPEPVVESNGLSTHWNLDLASLLAINILDVQCGDRVLDLCAAPGGKSIAIAQSVFADHESTVERSPSAGCLHANEFHLERMKRLKDNLRQYIPAAYRQSKKLLCLQQDGTNSALRFPLGLGGYDKVLLDAPCSSERHIVHAQERASCSSPPRAADELVRWSPHMAKRLAETQVKLLQNALRSVKVGGRVLYATCSISIEENDEVVEAAMKWASYQHKKSAISWICQPESLPASQETRLETWAERTRAGWIVLPDKETPCGSGWGPLYFAVLSKIRSDIL